VKVRRETAVREDKERGRHVEEHLEDSTEIVILILRRRKGTDGKSWRID